jgi:hypothetical protein
VRFFHYPENEWLPGVMRYVGPTSSRGSGVLWGQRVPTWRGVPALRSTERRCHAWTVTGRSRARGIRSWQAPVLVVLIPGLAACTTSKVPKAEVVTSTSTTVGSPSTATSSTSAPPPTTSSTVPISGSLSVSSTNVAVGHSITITGRGCPHGSYAEPHIIPDPLPAIFKQAGYEAAEWLLYDKNLQTDEVGANGIWTVTAPVPMVPPGAAKVTGWCQQSGSGDIKFDYPGVVVDVASSFGVAGASRPFDYGWDEYQREYNRRGVAQAPRLQPSYPITRRPGPTLRTARPARLGVGSGRFLFRRP